MVIKVFQNPKRGTKGYSMIGESRKTVRSQQLEEKKEML
jgi:hypothetical protein